MGWFSGKPKEAPAPNPAARDFVGKDIWDIVAKGLEHYGMILRRGSGTLGYDKWGDGKYHLKCEVDDKPRRTPTVELVTNAGDVIDVKVWNAYTPAELKEFVISKGARFKVIDVPLDEHALEVEF